MAGSSGGLNVGRERGRKELRGCRCQESQRAYGTAANCSCATTETSEGVQAEVLTHSPIGESCECKCEEATRAYCTVQNCSCTQGVGGGQSTTHSIEWTTGRSYDCGCGCQESHRAYCSAGKNPEIPSTSNGRDNLRLIPQFVAC